MLAGGGASAETLQEETECQRQVLENLLAWPGSWPAPPLLDERGGDLQSFLVFLSHGRGVLVAYD